MKGIRIAGTGVIPVFISGMTGLFISGLPWPFLTITGVVFIVTVKPWAPGKISFRNCGCAPGACNLPE